jgi:hypothetical protein
MAPKTLLKTTLLCILAAGANFLLNGLVAGILRLPLFFDTLFTVAAAFTAGLLPGIASAALTTIIVGLRYETPHTYLFVLCSIAEVFLVRVFQKRAALRRGDDEPIGGINGVPSCAVINTAVSLLLLALADCVVISILGGVIDYIIFAVISRPRVTFSPEDIFKIGLLRNNIPLLWANILARFPINLVDRFVVITAGYSVSRFLRRYGNQHPRGAACR